MSTRKLSKNSEESEKAIERYLCAQVKAAGGIPLKFSSGTDTGYPDRILIFPDGAIVWAEIKSKGENPTKLQSHRMQTLREDYKQTVYLCDSKEKVDYIIKNYKRIGIYRANRYGK